MLPTSHTIPLFTVLISIVIAARNGTCQLGNGSSLLRILYEWDQPFFEIDSWTLYTIKDYEIETPLTKSSTLTEADSVYEVKIDFNTKSSVAAINFVLKVLVEDA
ncbi:hypothetical protein Tco_0313255 [Tanacetum coccineum]